MGAAAYDERWARLEASGHDPHGEASLIERLLVASAPGRARAYRVLDAGCGTGRVAIRLAERGMATVGVDVDRSLVARAREKAPALEWVVADLAELGRDDVDGPFDAIVMAGNVMIFVAVGTEPAVVANLAARLGPGGLLVAGFQVLPGRLPLARYEQCTAAAGLTPVTRLATWDGEPFTGGDYVVAVDRAPTAAPTAPGTADGLDAATT
jgi:SAM-dependent methyltransferase